MSDDTTVPTDSEIETAIDSAFDVDLSELTDRELAEHTARSLAAIATALGKMGDALPATLANPLYRSALHLIAPKRRR